MEEEFSAPPQAAPERLHTGEESMLELCDGRQPCLKPGASGSKSLKNMLRGNRAEVACSSTSLKSILRSASSRTSPAAHRQMTHKLKRKRVQFALQQHEEKLDKWSGQRLRALALDLDRRDWVPGMHVRFVNKHKTRRTRRIDQYHRLDSASTEPSRLEASLSVPKFYFGRSKDQSIKKEPATIADMDSLQQSAFVNRWLEHASQMRDVTFLPGPPQALSGVGPAQSACPWDVFGANVYPLCAHPYPGPPGRNAVPSNVVPAATDSLASLSSDFNTLSLRWSHVRGD